MKKTGTCQPRSERRDAGLARRRHRELHRAVEADQGRAGRVPLPFQNPVNPSVQPPSVSTPAHASPCRPAFARPVPNKPASEWPDSRQLADQPTTSNATQTSEKTDVSHLAPSEGTTNTSGSTDPTLGREYEPTDFSDEEQTYTTASSEPEWTRLPERIGTFSDDSSALADSEPSDAEPDRRAWFCRVPVCRRLNPAHRQLCQHCRAGRFQTESIDCRAVVPIAGQLPRAETARSPSGDSCMLCHRQPADHAILHGRTACRVVCRGCARRLSSRRRHCPACRRKIEQIVIMWRG